jgi:hypothetical protein
VSFDVRARGILAEEDAGATPDVQQRGSAVSLELAAPAYEGIPQMGVIFRNQEAHRIWYGVAEGRRHI